MTRPVDLLLLPQRTVRRAYAGLALAVGVFAVYVSLLPFSLEPLSLPAALAYFRAVIVSWPARFARVNFIANVLLFLPIGFGVCGARLAGDSRRVSAGAVAVAMAFAVVTSLLAEFLQVFAPNRVVSAFDVAAHATGAAIGVVAWASVGPGITRWWTERHERSRRDRLSRVSTAYAACWTLAHLAPFDITLNADRLGRRLREGEIVLVPFAGPEAGLYLVWDVAVTILSAVPLGVLAMVGGQRADERRGTFEALALGLAIVGSVELAQVFIRSHSADVTDVLMGGVGCALGIWWGARALDRRAPVETLLQVSRPWAWVAAAAWCMVLVGYHWQPFDFSIDGSLFREKLRRLSLVPFAGYLRGSDLTALNNIISRTGLAVPLGAFAAIGLGRMRWSPRLMTLAWILASLPIFGVIELGQFFVPSRVPDPTDVVLGALASGAGFRVGLWFCDSDPHPRHQAPLD